MDDPLIPILILVILGFFLAAIVLPIVSLVIAIHSKRKVNAHLRRLANTTPLDSQTIERPDLAPLASMVQQLESRIAALESTLLVEPRTPLERPKPVEPIIPKPAEPSEVSPGAPSISSTPVAEPPIPLASGTDAVVEAPLPAVTKSRSDIESVIGRKWVGWVAIALILFATAFFIKYAFDNRWIGELGRVAIGVTAGVSLTLLGFSYYKRGWRIFSQILTAGGIVLLYLSVYAAFGYYHLVPQRAAFVYLIILIAEAAALAVLYDARSIAVMAVIGGFLAPVLLRSDRDQYRSLFGYIVALDVGTLSLPKRWLGLTSVTFVGTHLLFSLWYGENYHPLKLVAVMVFQTSTFFIFLLAPLGRRIIKREAATIEDLCLLPINAAVFFSTAYHLLDPEYHDWLGVFAIGMALVFALAAKLLIDRAVPASAEVLIAIGVSLTFVTIAVPIQLKANWITIAWAVQGLAMLWASTKLKSARLFGASGALFLLAAGKLVLWDTHLQRAVFTPVFNKYFLSSLVVTGCLFAAAALCRKFRELDPLSYRTINTVALLVAIVTLWFLLSVETFTYFSARAVNLQDMEGYRHQLWLAQMALSVLWSIYAATLAAIGFIKRTAVVRWAALGLFALTVIKVMLIDIAQLRQLYRIVAFLVLGLLLLIVAWGYHKAFRSKEPAQ